MTDITLWWDGAWRDWRVQAMRRPVRRGDIAWGGRVGPLLLTVVRKRRWT